MEHKATAARLCFDAFTDGPEPDALGMKPGHCLDQMFELASEAIQSPDDERVTTSQMRDGSS